jgi:hypothetical protein
MDALGNIASSYSNDRFRSQSGGADAIAAKQDIDGQVQAIKASAAPGSNTNVQYKYETGPNGELVPVSATVQSIQPSNSPQATQTTNTGAQAPALTGGGNLLALSPGAELDAFGLNADERAVVRELQARDLAVRVHEGQHLDAASGLASGGPEFSFQVGPDGKQYAVGGHVDVQTSATSDPEKTARDAQTFAHSAGAPGDASAQDLSVARDSLNSSAAALKSVNQQQITQATSAGYIAQADQPKNDGEQRTPLDIIV